MENLNLRHRLVIKQLEHDLVGLGMTPQFAIGQRAILLLSERGNILWDCFPLLDDITVEWVKTMGGISAIAISHPHFQATVVEWAKRFNAPIYVHEDDRSWTSRRDPSFRFWNGDTLCMQDGVTLVRCGGHYPGSAVLHWSAGANGKGTLLTGDTLQVIPGRERVSFMYAYPGLLPLSKESICKLKEALEPFHFETLHGGWWDYQISSHGKEVVGASVARYLLALA